MWSTNVIAFRGNEAFESRERGTDATLTTERRRGRRPGVSLSFPGEGQVSGRSHVVRRGRGEACDKCVVVCCYCHCYSGGTDTCSCCVPLRTAVNEAALVPWNRTVHRLPSPQPQEGRRGCTVTPLPSSPCLLRINLSSPGTALAHRLKARKYGWFRLPIFRDSSTIFHSSVTSPAISRLASLSVHKLTPRRQYSFIPISLSVGRVSSAPSSLFACTAG